MQGRMTAADYALGVRCNLELVGRAGPGIGGFRTHRYVDPQGHECAYYDRFPGAPSNPGVALGERPYRALSAPTFAPERIEIWYTTATTASSP